MTRFGAARWARVLGALLLALAATWPTSADEAKPQTAILLRARAELPDANFRDSVVLVLNNLGPAPVGVIVNRPTRMSVSQLFPDLERREAIDEKVYFGGPVAITSVSYLFRADAPSEHAVRVLDGVYLATDAELLRTLLRRDRPMDGLRIFVGHAGWGPGQLEAEIARGDWSLAPATPDALFGGRSERPWPERDDPRAGRRT